METVKPAVLFAFTLVLLDVQASPAETQSPGETKFRATCIGCHSIACNRTGPKLEGIFGRRAGTVPDFGSYTSSIRDSGIVWSDESLDAFLRDPAKLIPGTAMATVRVDGADDRRDIVTYLRLQDRSVDICF